MLYAGATEETSVALRSNQGGSVKLYYLAADHHGTQNLAVEAVTQGITRRYLNAFGEERAQTGGDSWVDDRGFLGKPHDKATGLTHVGAREYDPVLGAFVSVDPAGTGEAPVPQRLRYAENNPVTLSDPSGQSNRYSCTMGVDCGIDEILADMFAAPPFDSGGGSGGGGTSGTAGATSLLPPGVSTRASSSRSSPCRC
ncbi:RHS repeat-associated core domain-containing protein [Streptomyces sp. NBC_00342]|uniref:RHS repeat-associated core domain-containing protein n=1 Tax=Streptomyces sp. NBC_00342 TaxID=2975718 RepID=UPI002E2A0D20|nr:RHS repeat-associated core domain-containing protein [Streptomyces sp. NBC_00342]